MDNSNPKSGFTLENIILIESSFKRISDVIFDKKAQNSFDINVGVASAEPRIAVTVDVNATVFLFQSGSGNLHAVAFFCFLYVHGRSRSVHARHHVGVEEVVKEV